MSHYSFKLSLIAAAAIILSTAAGAQTIKSTIPLPSVPEGVAVNFGTDRVYVALPSFGGATDSLAVINGITDSVIKTISIPPIGYAVATDQIRNKIYVGGCFLDANSNNTCEVAQINGFTDKVDRVIPITTTEGLGIQGIAVDSITGLVYVSNASDDVIDVLQDKFGKTLVTTISLNGQSPVGLSVNPFSNHLYVALDSSMVDIIDLGSKTIVSSTTVGTSNGGAAVDVNSGNVVVANTVFGPSNVGVLTSTGTVLATVPVGNTPFGVDVDPFTHLAFVTDTIDQSVSVVNDKTNTLVETLPINGYFVSVNPISGKVYVGGQNASITVIKE